MFNIGLYYKGFITHKEIQTLPIPYILKMSHFASRINKDKERQIKRET